MNLDETRGALKKVFEDKLSKAYIKAGLENEAKEFLKGCYQKEELNEQQYLLFVQEIELFFTGSNKE